MRRLIRLISAKNAEIILRRIFSFSLHNLKSTYYKDITYKHVELYKAVSDSMQEDKANPATKEVLRYREALWEGYLHQKEQNEISLESIIAIFRQIKNTSGGIRSPHTLTFIRRGQSEFRTGEIIYTPPRGAGVIERYMENLLEYLNNDNTNATDPLLKMCISHYQFEAIHPFPDGNGRTGRILNLLYLVKKKLLDLPVLYLSKYIIVNKDDYYYYLGAVTQRRDWKSWILFMLEAVEQTSDLTNQLISSILDQMEATLEHGKTNIKWYNKEVNEILFSQPYIRQSFLGEKLQVSSRTTLTKYFHELEQHGILFQEKDGREVFYVNRDLMRILEGQ